MSVELEFLRDELAVVERQIREKELAPLDHRLVDEDRWRESLTRLRTYRLRLRERILEEEDCAA